MNVSKKAIVILNLVLLVSITFLSVASYAQQTQYLTYKPGKFILQNQLNKCQGDDIVSLAKNLTVIAEWIHKNDSIVDLPVGFDAAVSLTGNSCDKDAGTLGYGIHSRISFSLRYFYLENGVSLTASDWAAHGTEILINNPINLISNQFTEAEFKTDDPPRLEHPLEKALENLQRYFTTASVLKEIVPGVRLYAPGTGWFKGSILIFNPNRPDIWIPVTVKEIMEAKLAYYRIKQEIDSINYEKMVADWAKMNFNPDPEKTMRPRLYRAIKEEYENFTTEELNRPAFAGSEDQFSISMINARGEGRAVVKFNPACWDKALPSTAVQFISIEYRPATTLELEEFKESDQGLTDYVGLFFNNLPVEKMGGLIHKK